MLTHPTTQPDVKCPECGHDADAHDMGYCRHVECRPPDAILSACIESEASILRAALSASEAALAEAKTLLADADIITIPGLHQQLAEARAEVERLRCENASITEWNESVAVCKKHAENEEIIIRPGCILCDLEAAETDIAAERHRIATAVRGITVMVAPFEPISITAVNRRVRILADRIASGHFAQQEEVRDA